MINKQRGSVVLAGILAGTIILAGLGVAIVKIKTPVVPQGNVTMEAPVVTVEAPDNPDYLGLIKGLSENRLGSLVNVIQKDFSGGISVNGTEIISSSGGLTPTTGSFSSTLTVTGASTLSSTLTVSGESNLARMIQGGSVANLTTASTTLTAAQVCDNTIIIQTASTSKQVMESLGTYTLPAATTLHADCLSANGDTMTILFRNATSSYGASTTIARNTGLDLLEPSGGDVVILPQESARLFFTRETLGTTTVEVTSLQKAD